jgi:hypothetical protein
MPTLFRRHMKDCKFRTRKHRNCNCSVAVEGVFHGRKIRKSLDLRSWEATQKFVRDWEANPQGGGLTVNDGGESGMCGSIRSSRPASFERDSFNCRITLGKRKVRVGDVQTKRSGSRSSA